MIPPLLVAADSAAAIVLLELGGVLVIVALLTRLAARVGLPAIPLYLVAGLFLGAGGPIGLDASAGFIEVGANLGVVLLLFFLGLEYAAEDITEHLRANLPAGALDLVNALPGAIVALALGWSPVAAVALAGVTYISSSGVVAKALTDLGRLGNRETPTVLAVLVIEDLVMALYLPIFAGLAAGGVLVGIGVSVLTALGVVVVVSLVALRWGHHLSTAVFSRSDEVVLFSILGVVLLIAGVGERVGVSAGVGSFLVGIALSGPAQRSAEALLAPLRDLFAAIFFIFFTFRIDAGSLGGTVAPALLLAGVTIVLKVATGWWAARRAGIGATGRLRAGTALVAHGEFSIVIAGIAVANGVEAGLASLTASYVLVLAVLGPILTRFADPVGDHLAARRHRPT